MATSELTFDVRLDLAAFSAAIDQARTTLANFVQSIPPITIPVALAMPANAQSAVAGLVPPVAQAQAQAPAPAVATGGLGYPASLATQAISVTDAERALAAQFLQTEAVARGRASALGINVSQLRAVEAANVAASATPATPLSGWQGALQNLQGGLASLGSTGGRLGGLASSINSMLNPLAQAGQSSGLVSSALQTFGVPAGLAGEIGAIAPQLLGALAVIGLVTAGFMSMMDGIRGAMDQASELNDEIARTGIGAEDLMIAGEAMRTAGLSSSTLGMSLMFLNKAMGDADGNNIKGAKSFEKLGLSVEALRKMPQVESFKTTLSAVNDLESHSEKITIMKDLFGRSGIRLLSLASDPAAFDNASKMLGRNTTLMAQNKEAFDKASDDMGGLLPAKMQGFYLAAGAQVVGPLQDILDLFATMDFTPIGTFIGQLMQPIMVIGAYLMKVFVSLFDVVNLILAVLGPVLSVIGLVFDGVRVVISLMSELYNSDSGLGGIIKGIVTFFTTITEEIDAFRKEFLAFFGAAKEPEKAKKDVEKENNDKAVVDSLQAIGGGGGVSSGADAGLSAAKTTADSTKATAANTAKIADTIQNGGNGGVNNPPEAVPVGKMPAVGDQIPVDIVKEITTAVNNGLVPANLLPMAQEAIATGKVPTGFDPSMIGMPSATNSAPVAEAQKVAEKSGTSIAGILGRLQLAMVTGGLSEIPIQIKGIMSAFSAINKDTKTSEPSSSGSSGSSSSSGRVMALGGAYNYQGGETPQDVKNRLKLANPIATPSFTGTDSSFSGAGGGFGVADDPDAPLLSNLPPAATEDTKAVGAKLLGEKVERDAELKASKENSARLAQEAQAKKEKDAKDLLARQNAAFNMVNPATGYSLKQEADQQLKTFNFNNSLTSSSLGSSKFAQDGFTSSALKTQSLVGVSTPTLTRKGDMNTFEQRFGGGANLVSNNNASTQAADAGGVVNPLTGTKESSGTGSPADKVQALLAKLVANTDPAKNQGVKLLMPK